MFFPRSGSESGFHFSLDPDPDPVSVSGSQILGTKTYDCGRSKKEKGTSFNDESEYRIQIRVFFPKSGFGLETLETCLS